MTQVEEGSSGYEMTWWSWRCKPPRPSGASLGGPRGVAEEKLRREHQVGEALLLARRFLEHESGGGFAQLFRVRAGRGDRRLALGGDGRKVRACHAEIGRHPPALAVHFAHGAGCHQGIVGDEGGGEILSLGEWEE